MHRSSSYVMAFLLITAPALAQKESDAETLNVLLTEVRQLRQDLRNAFTVAQRTQVVLYRLQSQEAAVARARQRLDEGRSKLTQVQAQRMNAAAQIQNYEDSKSHIQNPIEREDSEQALSQLKAKLDRLGNEEQQSQVGAREAEEQLQSEQEKLNGLQDLLNRLDSALESFGSKSVGSQR